MTTLFKLDTKKKIGVLFDNKSNTIKKFYLTPRNKDKELINEFLGFQWYIKKLYKTNRDNFIIIILGLILFFYANQIYYVYNRVAYYFFIPFLFLDYKELLKINKRALFTLILFVLFIISLNLKTFPNGDNGSMIPYKTILKHIF